MTSSLGLAGDLDDVDLVEDVEAAFSIHLADDEISRCSTVGQLFELIEARLRKCLADNHARPRCAAIGCGEHCSRTAPMP